MEDSAMVSWMFKSFVSFSITMCYEKFVTYSIDIRLINRQSKASWRTFLALWFTLLQWNANWIWNKWNEKSIKNDFESFHMRVLKRLHGIKKEKELWRKFIFYATERPIHPSYTCNIVFVFILQRRNMILLFFHDWD